MSKIDPAMLDQLDTGWVFKRDQYGNILACKGPWLPDYFDNYTEALRENQNANRVSKLKAQGLNPQGQTEAQSKAFENKRKIQLIKKEKAETALLASENFGGK